MGAPLAETKKERAGIYLTNALTGWGAQAPSKQKLLFTEMAEERDAAEKVKHRTPIIVVLGNPPYYGRTAPPIVRFRDFWGENKREDLLASLSPFDPAKYTEVTPIEALGLVLRPLKMADDFAKWPLMPMLFPKYFTGIKTSRDEDLVDISADDLAYRMRSYFDPNVSHEQLSAMAPSLMRKTEGFSPIKTREVLRKKGCQAESAIRFVYRPFDIRWLYWESTTKLLDRSRPEYIPHVFEGNIWITAAQQNRKSFDPPVVMKDAATIHIIERSANLFPMLVRTPAAGESLFLGTHSADKVLGEHTANVSDAVLDYFSSIGGSVQDAPHLFHHVVAILHASAYASENGDALRYDWPRLPLPSSRDALLSSANLGRRVAALLEPDTPVPEVTTGKLRPELRGLGRITVEGSTAFNESGGDGEVNVRWGMMTDRGVMPSHGKLTEREFAPDELAAVGEQAVQLLGPTTLDIWLNDRVYWKNVPEQVWNYFLGGYQVLKKWLSYREKAILGRDLTAEEVGHFEKVVRRIAGLLLLDPALDANYTHCKADTYLWPSTVPEPEPASDDELPEDDDADEDSQ